MQATAALEVPKIVAMGDRQHLASLGETVVIVGHSSLKPEDVYTARGCIEQIRNAHDGRCAALIVVLEDVKPPGSEARGLLKELIAEAGLNSLAVVVEGDGLSAAAIISPDSLLCPKKGEYGLNSVVMSTTEMASSGVAVPARQRMHVVSDLGTAPAIDGTPTAGAGDAESGFPLPR